MKKKILFLAMLFFTAFSFNAKAQPGANDTTFNPTDQGFGYGDGIDDEVLATAIQNDGKIIIGGDFISYNGTARSHIARLNTDGSLDTTFIVGTGANSYVYTIAIQSDGKIIIVGYFISYNGTAINHIARLNTDGSLDATFIAGTGANNAVLATAIQSDGKIIIGGNFTSYNGIGRNRLARILNCINTNGLITATACESYTLNGTNYTATGVYMQTLVNTAGCDSIITLNLTINTVDTSVVSNGNTLTANATSANYQWIDCDNANTPIAGEVSQSFTATVNGNYAVIVTQNSCSDTSSCYNINIIGIGENPLTIRVNIYPNPSDGHFIIDVQSSKFKVQSLDVYNVFGEKVYATSNFKQQTPNGTGQASDEIDLSKSPSGIYFAKIYDGEKIYSRKIVVQ